MNPEPTQTKSIGWIIAAAAAAAGIFVFDFVTPLGIAVPMLYALPILLTRRIPGWRSTLSLTACVVPLTWAGIIQHVERVTPVVVGNRALTSLLLLVVAGLLLKEKSLAQQRATDLMALRESEERYALVVAGSQVAIWDWNVPEKRVFFSSRWKALRGLADDEVSDDETEWSSRIHPDDRERVMAAVCAHFEGRTAVFCEEYRIRHKDGCLLWILDHGIAQRDSAGKVIRMAGSETDITERKRTEEVLRENEERFRTMAEAVPSFLFETDAAGRNVWTSEGWCRFTGQTPEQVAGHGWVEALHPDDRTANIDRWMQCMVDGTPFESQQRLRRVDGTYAWVIARALPVRDSQGMVTRWVGSVTDVDAIVRAEEEQSRLAAIVEGTTDAIVGKDLHGVITSWNKGAEILLGYTAAEVIGKPVTMLFPPDQVDEELSILDRLKRGESIRYQEAVRRRKDGHEIPVSLVISPILDQQGRIIGGSKILRDITARKQTEELLRESEERLLLALDSASMGTWDWDSETDSLLWNSRQFELFGILTEACQPTGTEALSRIHSEDRARVAAAVRKVMKEGATVRDEFRVFHADGSVRWLFGSGRPVQDEHGQCRHVVGVCLDITERRRDQERMQSLNEILEARMRERTASLVEANERWDWVVRATNDGIWDWDLVHDTAYFSPRWKEMHGFQECDRAESTKEWLARIHPEDCLRVLKALERCHAEKGSQFHEEYRVLKEDGTYFWVLDRGVTVFNDKGRAIRMIGAETDITWRKEAEMLLREREAQLRDLGARLLRAQEEERRRISMDLHDDVMQRMGALTLDLYGLVSSAASSDRELQSQLKACGASAEQLTTDLQRMAHQLHPSILEFGGLEVAAREHVHEFTVRTGLSAELLTRDLPKNIPLDHATCLYRVLQEGLQNVQKHAAATTVLVRLLGTGRGVGLCVHDDGHGIEEVDGAARRKGLGLTSMAERVRMLNGTFRVRTKPGDGTEIHAWVPLEDVKCET